MKISEHIKFSLTMLFLPWIPAFLLYRHSNIEFAKIILITFIILSLICFINKKMALKIKDIIKYIGKFIGKYIAIAVLLIAYIVTIIPVGILMKLVKRDRLKIKKPNVESYWIDNENNSTDYEYQF